MREVKIPFNPGFKYASLKSKHSCNIIRVPLSCSCWVSADPRRATQAHLPVPIFPGSPDDPNSGSPVVLTNNLPGTRHLGLIVM